MNGPENGPIEYGSNNCPESSLVAWGARLLLRMGALPMTTEGAEA